MLCLSAVLFIVFTSGVFSEDSLLTPCEIQDRECLSKTTQEFLKNTSKGIPKYDIRAIDPLLIPSLNYTLSENPLMKMRLRNISVTGLKNQKFSDLKMDTKTKTVLLQTEVDINVTSDLVVELANGKIFSDLAYSIKGAALGTATYGYDFKVDDNGIEHYEVGPETITCQAVGDPKVTLSSDSEKDKDLMDSRIKFDSIALELRNKEICQIVKIAYITLVHNIRAAAKILPKSAFLKGV